MATPTANPDTLVATEDMTVTYTAGNDIDAGSDTLTIASVTSGAGGTATLDLDGTVTFMPTANFNRAADSTYTASDGTTTSDAATVTVDMSPVDEQGNQAGGGTPQLDLLLLTVRR